MRSSSEIFSNETVVLIRVITIYSCVEAQSFRFGRKRSGKVKLYDMIVLIARKNNYR